MHENKKRSSVVMVKVGRLFCEPFAFQPTPFNFVTDKQCLLKEAEVYHDAAATQLAGRAVRPAHPPSGAGGAGGSGDASAAGASDAGGAGPVLPERLSREERFRAYHNRHNGVVREGSWRPTTLYRKSAQKLATQSDNQLRLHFATDPPGWRFFQKDIALRRWQRWQSWPFIGVAGDLG